MRNNPVIELIAKLNPLSEKCIQDFLNIISFDILPKNAVLLEIGQRARSMYFIKKGLARAYYYHDGKEVTDYFAVDGQFIGAVPSLINGLPSNKGIHLIETSEIYQFSSEAFEACCLQHHDLERATRRLTAFALLEEQERIESLRFYSVREKYDLVARKYPGIMNRCPLQYIASYIGTSQVSISRIRAGTQ
ncbi:MAG: Crp/Fnr family transcriptional regulator [Lewinellaceae bacterium]|nr:Crp/Fnr family transcriptional regulator [Saprospiraceae bacterium]MCB9342999.1 Crp/Fnr family transcriptional regulator [Lewinellaceae bacterium]